jgi:lipopolysaccharide export LptBFGC system permease protein LptF
MGTQPADTERSTAELVKDLSEQVSALVRDELKLAGLELSRKGKQAGLAGGMFGGAAVIGLFGIGCLVACAAIALAGVLAAWLAVLIVGAALLAIAGLVALTGKSRLAQAAPPVPQEAISSVQSDVQEIKERARR